MRLFKPLPDVLTLLRLVCAFAFVWAVVQRNWDAAFLAMAVGALTDPVDGRLALVLKLPAKRWYGLTGKAFNEVASGALSVLPPVALAVVPLWDDEQPQSMGLWIGLCVFFGVATLWFNRNKSAKNEPNAVRRERVEVLQGWFTGFIWLCCGAQALALSSSGESLAGWVTGAVIAFVATMLSAHRWTKRPEVIS